jgi:O-succinylbenzoic acid--CoA ligase
MAFLSRTSTTHHDAPALDDGREVWTYGELHRQAEGVALRLLALGVEPGETVAFQGVPGPEMVVALHGAWMAGAAVTVFHHRQTRDEDAASLRLLEPDVLLMAGEGHPGRAAAALGPREVRTVGIPGVSPIPPLEAVSPHSGPLPSASWFTGAGRSHKAAVLRTSGTSGLPRAVTLTFDNLLASARAASDRLGLGSTDRWLASLSPAHVGGLATIARSALVGSALVMRKSFEEDSLPEAITTGAVTHAPLVPTVLRRLLYAWGSRPVPDSLRCLLIGGAPAPEDLLHEAIGKGFPLALTYGLTEAGSQVATAPPDLVRRKPGTVGPPLAGLEVRIGGHGEVLARGSTVSPDYQDEDGWLHTGDLGHLDQDGHLWITGRLSDRILTGGVNVDPGEVEEVLRSHPGVADVAVVGVPDREWGERVVAALVPTAPGRLKSEALDRLAREAVSPAKRPRTYLVVTSLPRNPNGKVDRQAVQRLFD